MLDIRRRLSGMIFATLLVTPLAPAATDFPAYKPSSRSAAAVDIRTSAYGASADAPHALDIGATVTDFSVRRVGGGLAALRTLRQQGPVVIIFYRGHW
jgi:hypothetical protein